MKMEVRSQHSCVPSKRTKSLDRLGMGDTGSPVMPHKSRGTCSSQNNRCRSESLDRHSKAQELNSINNSRNKKVQRQVSLEEALVTLRKTLQYGKQELKLEPPTSSQYQATGQGSTNLALPVSKDRLPSPQSSQKLLEQFLERKRQHYAYRSLPRLKIGGRDTMGSGERLGSVPKYPGNPQATGNTPPLASHNNANDLSNGHIGAQATNVAQVITTENPSVTAFNEPTLQTPAISQRVTTASPQSNVSHVTSHFLNSGARNTGETLTSANNGNHSSCSSSASTSRQIQKDSKSPGVALSCEMDESYMVGTKLVLSLSELRIMQWTLVCTQEKFIRKGPLAPTFSIAYGSATTGWIHFKFGTCKQ